MKRLALGTRRDRVRLAAADRGVLGSAAALAVLHAVQGGWRRAAGGRANASGLYLFAYYLGSSVGGPAGGLAYEHGRWPATVAYGLILLSVALPATLGVRVSAGERARASSRAVSAFGEEA